MLRSSITGWSDAKLWKGDIRLTQAEAACQSVYTCRTSICPPSSAPEPPAFAGVRCARVMKVYRHPVPPGAVQSFSARDVPGARSAVDGVVPLATPADDGVNVDRHFVDAPADGFKVTDRSERSFGAPRGLACRKALLTVLVKEDTECPRGDELDSDDELVRDGLATVRAQIRLAHELGYAAGTLPRGLHFQCPGHLGLEEQRYLHLLCHGSRLE